MFGGSFSGERSAVIDVPTPAAALGAHRRHELVDELLLER